MVNVAGTVVVVGGVGAICCFWWDAEFDSSYLALVATLLAIATNLSYSPRHLFDFESLKVVYPRASPIHAR
jgi:hypothetical protein